MNLGKQPALKASILGVTGALLAGFVALVRSDPGIGALPGEAAQVGPSPTATRAAPSGSAPYESSPRRGRARSREDDDARPGAMPAPAPGAQPQTQPHTRSRAS